VSKLGSERRAVQDRIVKYATEVGWQYLPPNESTRLRHDGMKPILWDVFIERVQGLNSAVVDRLKAEEIANRVIRAPSSIEGNLQAWEYLRGLKTVFVETERRERNIHLLDFDAVHRNTFHVTDEFRFTNGVNAIRADIAFLINGIPILLIETKAVTKLEGINEALDQVRRYHREAPELLSIAQVYALTHLVQFYYGATWNTSRKNLFNWKEESAGQDFESLVKHFVARERMLRVLRDYILFTRKDDELAKVILRPHQMRAVERALGRAQNKEKQRGLVWHTQGSGKTYTMITIAKRLIEEPVFENPTVLMLVDRNELESQLFGNLAATLLGQSVRPYNKLGYYTQIGNISIAESKKGLRELLKDDTRGLIVTMIHKFDDIPANINTRSNIFVLVDEAHRTTGGDLGNFLMGALPNATYLGFTGTPIDKTSHGKGTFKVFGKDDPNGYLDKYSISESISDGTTVPLYYSLAPNELQVDKETLEKEFLNLREVQGVSDVEDLNRVLERAVTLRNMLKNRDRVQRIAQYVAKHYTENVEPMGYKGFLVGVDREACTLLKAALDDYLPPEYSRVIISAAQNDREEIAKYHLSEEEEKRIRKDFIDSEKLPKILIVTEKLLTGYDAPVLYCMYLDKPMRDHVLLQAIARVNRPYEDENGKRKPGGFIVDFVGIFDNLEKALAFDSKDVKATIEGIDLLKDRFKDLIKIARTEYLPIATGKAADKAVEAAINAFMDEEERHGFYRFFKEIETLYEIISPDPFLREFMGDYEMLADMYSAIRAAFDGNEPIDRELARKTAYLVQEHTQAGMIHESVKIYEITPDTLRIIAESDQPDNVKVFNLLKSIQKKVEEEGEFKPYLISIGERAEQIANAFIEHQEDVIETLRQLEEEAQKMLEAARQQAEMDVSAEAFTVYWLLQQSGVEQEKAEKATDEIEATLEKHPYWRTNDGQARKVRRTFYSQLEKIGVKKIKEAVDNIMRIIQRGSNG